MSLRERDRNMKSVRFSHRKVKIHAVAFLCLVLLVGSTTFAFASQTKRKLPQPEAILLGYLEARRNLNLRGTETVIVQPPRGAMITMTRQVTHTKTGLTLTRWLEPTSERNITIVDDGVWSKCYHPGERITKVSRSTTRPSDAQSTAKTARLIMRNYRVALEGIAPMAGRSCYKLRLTPLHSISSVVRMWIDRETSALLSHMEETARGETLRVAFFNGVEFPKRLDTRKIQSSIPAAAREVSFSRSEVLRSLEEVRKRAAFEFCAPYAMPGGYEFQRAELLSLKGVLTTCIRYSDGLSEITVCQNRSVEQRPAEYHFTQPMVDPMGNNIVDYRLGQMNYYLVGRCQMNGLLAVTNVLDRQRERVFLEYLSRNYRTPMGTLAGLRNQGMGLDTLDALLAIQKQIDVPLSSLVSLCKDGHSWAAIARRFRANVGRIVKHVRTFECR